MRTTSYLADSASSGKRLAGGPALWFVLFFTFVLYISPQSYLPFLEKLHIAKVAALFAVLSFFLAARNQSVSMTKPEKYVLVLAFLALCSIPFSSWRGGSFAYFIDIFSKVLIIYFLMSRVLVTERHLEIMFALLVACNVFFAIVALSNYADGVYLKGTRIGGPQGGIAHDPNDLALSLVTVFPLALCLAKIATSRFKKTIYYLCAGLMVCGIVVSFSRGGFLALVVAGFVLLMHLPKRKIVRIVFIGLLALPLIIAVLPDTYLERLVTIVDIEKDPHGTAGVRFDDMRDSMKAVLENPLLGAGLGMNTLGLQEVRGRMYWGGVHSAPLQIASELGIPALLAYIALMVVLLKELARLRSVACGDALSDRRYQMAGYLQAALWGFIVAGIFLPVAYRWYFFYLAGMATALIRIHKSLGDAKKTYRVGT